MPPLRHNGLNQLILGQLQNTDFQKLGQIYLGTLLLTFLHKKSQINYLHKKSQIIIVYS